MGNSGENFEGYDYVGGGTMDFSTYSRLVTWFFENDNREENYQNRILIPLFEKLCKGNNVVDTSLLTKEWNKRKIDREAFAGTFTPDLLIASNWKLIKDKDTVGYKALVEVKTPTANDRPHAVLEIKEYLEKVTFVILTDCVTWEFYMKKDNKIYRKIYFLDRLDKNIPIADCVTWEFYMKNDKNKPIVCKRHQKRTEKIEWDDTYWDDIKLAIQNLKIEIEKENKNDFGP